MSDQDVVIVSAKRTPIGAFQGALSPVPATQLGATAIKAAVEAAGLKGADIQEVIMGCVLPAGLGQAPARQAALSAGISINTPATTINKMCGSGLKAVMMAADQIRAGKTEIVLAGGLESMSNAPYLLPKARGGYGMGHGEVLDHMICDGLQSAFDGRAMGCFGDSTAARYNFSRAAQDSFAAESVRRALRAMQQGDFAAEVVPVTAKTCKGENVVSQDETPETCNIEKIPTLKPAFSKDGGALCYADENGLPDVVRRMRELRCGDHGECWAIAPLLLECVWRNTRLAWYGFPSGRCRRQQVDRCNSRCNLYRRTFQKIQTCDVVH